MDSDCWCFACNLLGHFSQTNQVFYATRLNPSIYYSIHLCVILFSNINPISVTEIWEEVANFIIWMNSEMMSSHESIAAEDTWWVTMEYILKIIWFSFFLSRKAEMRLKTKLSKVLTKQRIYKEKWQTIVPMQYNLKVFELSLQICSLAVEWIRHSSCVL